MVTGTAADDRTVVTAEKNPIFPGMGLCDPHMRVVGDRVYAYLTHDHSPGNRGFVMKDWRIWSSPDLVEWRYESTLRPEETYIGPSNNCWAPEIAERDGRFFLYFSNGMTDSGVAVSDRPGGPFQDALGGPLLPGGICPTRSYDPAVFIDDDPARTPWIIFGTPTWASGDSYWIAQLGDDMISLAGPPRKIQLDDSADDKPYLHKRNGVYYLTWQSFYAVADNVLGPYRTVGNTGAAVDHGCFFPWRSQWFHAFGMPDPTGVYRSTGICYVHYRDNGEMVSDQMIVEHGVGRYDARWHRIEAEWYFAAHGVAKLENSRASFETSGAADGSWLFFPRVGGLAADTRLSLFGACTNPSGCVVEVRRDAPDGALLGRCEVEKNCDTDRHDWRGYSTFLCDLANPPGSLDIYLVFRGVGDDLFRLDWFRFV